MNAMAKRAGERPSAPVAAPSKLAEAREVGFAQTVHALRVTLRATPAGWALVAWLAHGLVPWSEVLLWIGIFGTSWVVNVLILRRVEREGSSVRRHHGRLMSVALADGVCWGLVVLLLMNHDRYLDAWLTVVLCGIASINLPTYITYPPAFRMLVAAVWFTVTFSALYLLQGMRAATELVGGLLAYFIFLLFTVRSISSRVIEGIRLQLDNAALAGELQATLRHVERQATTDALTGQLNRRALDVLLQRSIDEAESRSVRFSILMLDVDHFKRINDTHGHPVGDQALRSVAERVTAQLRGGDSCARYGGEEFVVLLPGAALAQACAVGERIRGALANAALPTSPPLVVTASIGVAEYEPGMRVEGLLAAADSAVYAAKRSGRDQVRAAHAAAIQPGAPMAAPTADHEARVGVIAGA